MSIVDIIGLIGGLAGLGSIVWQILSFVHSKPKIRINISRVYGIDGDDGNEEYYLFTISNSKNQLVNIVDVSCKLPQGMSAHMVGSFGFGWKVPPLPWPINPYDDYKFYVPKQWFLNHLASFPNKNNQVEFTFKDGTGKSHNVTVKVKP